MFLYDLLKYGGIHHSTLNIFHTFSNVSLVGFKQVNVAWVHTKKIFFLFFQISTLDFFFAFCYPIFVMTVAHHEYSNVVYL